MKVVCTFAGSPSNVPTFALNVRHLCQAMLLQSLSMLKTALMTRIYVWGVCISLLFCVGCSHQVPLAGSDLIDSYYPSTCLISMPLDSRPFTFLLSERMQMVSGAFTSWPRALFEMDYIHPDLLKTGKCGTFLLSEFVRISQPYDTLLEILD